MSGQNTAWDHWLVTTWMRCYWDEEDTWFYFEVDAEGLVIRQIELEGPDLTSRFHVAGRPVGDQKREECP
ncbi:hypothetical protein ABZ705_34150 [Streptomyces sp. NPDC006984]|uniref:hypothetical protein n=1 Tax=Streptomyces sp. NPDC006984 TaxID=3155463 RepID=UPI0033FC70A5